MINRVPVPGVWYADCLPSGEWAAVIPDQFKALTSQGSYELAKNLLYIRIERNPFRFCGQDLNGAGNYEVTNGVGKVVGPSISVNPVIYKDGQLVQATSSHQGYRFVSDAGVLVTGDESMHDPVHQIYEYTDTDGFRIGQGQESGVHVVCPDGTKRVLEPGGCYFIRVRREGDRFAIAIVKLQENQAVLFWLDKADLLQLPIYGLPPVEPPVEPPIEPPVEPPIPPVEPPVIPPQPQSPFIKHTIYKGN